MPVFRRVRKIAKNDYYLPSCLSVGTKQLGSLWTDFHEIWYLNIFFFKSVEKIPVLLKTDNNKRYFTRRLIYMYDSTLSVLLRFTTFFEQNFWI